MTIQPRLLRAQDAAAYCSVSVSLWAQLVKESAAPGPITLSERVKVWDRAALDKWIDALGAGAPDGFAGVE